MKFYPKKFPRNNDHRYIRRFAWSPTIMSNGVSVWLESYEAHQLFENGIWNDMERSPLYSYWC